MKNAVLRFAFAALIAIGLFLSASAQTPTLPTKPGAIKVGKVDGSAFRGTADGQSLPIKTGDILIETDTITTAKGGVVVLVFANGSSVKVGSESKLKIEEFKMDPLAEDVVISKLEREPSVSTTSLSLSYGEMVGDVKHLNKERGSSFAVKTPVGAAGIRGTTFRIVYRPSGDGKSFTFTLSTADGKVVFEGSAQAPANIEVPKNEEITVTAEVKVDVATGNVVVESVQVPQATSTISTEAAQAIVAAVVEVKAAEVKTVITTTEQQQSSETKTDTSSTDNTGNTGNTGDTGNTGNTGDTGNTGNTNNPDSTNPPPTNPPPTNPPPTNPPPKTSTAPATNTGAASNVTNQIGTGG